MDLELYAGIAAVPIIVGLVELAKRTGFDPKYGGILAVVLGVAISFGYTFFSETGAFKALIVGLAVGLSAPGLFSTVKNAKEK